MKRRDASAIATRAWTASHVGAGLAGDEQINQPNNRSREPDADLARFPQSPQPDASTTPTAPPVWPIPPADGTRSRSNVAPESRFDSRPRPFFKEPLIKRGPSPKLNFPAPLRSDRSSVSFLFVARRSDPSIHPAPVHANAGAVTIRSPRAATVSPSKATTPRATLTAPTPTWSEASAR